MSISQKARTTKGFQLASLLNSLNSSISLQRGILFTQIHSANQDQIPFNSLLNLQFHSNNRSESLFRPTPRLYKDPIIEIVKEVKLFL